jgi:hypothetical protein
MFVGGRGAWEVDETAGGDDAAGANATDRRSSVRRGE